MSNAIPDHICGICYHPKEDVESCMHPECNVCRYCHGTGWLHGCQNWSEKFIKKNGSPYYSEKCGCGTVRKVKDE